MDNNLGLTKFKHLKAFWCQKVLPLVYDESLSYYEVLCKLIHFINQLIDAINEMVDVLEEHDARITILENWKNTLDQWKTEIETRVTNIENGTTPIPLPIATATRLGVVKIGEGVNVQADGTISVEGGSSPYVLPTMDDDVKGGARLGEGLVITDTDKLDVDVDNLDLSNNESITSIQNDITEINENITNIEGDIQNIEGDVQALNTDITNIISGDTPVPSSYELPTMSSSTKGGAKLGDGLDITNDTLSVDSDNLDLSNNGTIQNIIDGTTEIDISNNETIENIISGDTPVPSSYELPTMSASTKGGAKVGNGLSVDSNDKLNVDEIIINNSQGTTNRYDSIFGTNGNYGLNFICKKGGVNAVPPIKRDLYPNNECIVWFIKTGDTTGYWIEFYFTKKVGVTYYTGWWNDELCIFAKNNSGTRIHYGDIHVEYYVFNEQGNQEYTWSGAFGYTIPNNPNRIYVGRGIPQGQYIKRTAVPWFASTLSSDTVVYRHDGYSDFEINVEPLTMNWGFTINNGDSNGTQWSNLVTTVETLNNRVASNVPQSTETDYPTVTEFNALLTSLKTAGLMEAD